MPNSMSDRALLQECAEALERLLSSPDLHLEGLEESTLQAIEQAYSVHQQISTRLQQVYCVLCGELLPDQSFTEADRGQLVERIVSPLQVKPLAVDTVEAGRTLSQMPWDVG